MTRRVMWAFVIGFFVLSSAILIKGLVSQKEGVAAPASTTPATASTVVVPTQVEDIVKDLNSKKILLEDEVNELKGKKETLTTEVDRLQSRKSELDSDVAELTSRIRQLALVTFTSSKTTAYYYVAVKQDGRSEGFQLAFKLKPVDLGGQDRVQVVGMSPDGSQVNTLVTWNVADLKTERDYTITVPAETAATLVVGGNMYVQVSAEVGSGGSLELRGVNQVMVAPAP